MSLISESEIIRVENGADVILVLLFSGGSKKSENEEIMGNTRLVKLIFLLEKETSLRQYLRDFLYEAYNYGPFSSELYDALQALVNAGLVRDRQSESEGFLDEADRFHIERQTGSEAESLRNTTVYSLTRKGIIVASTLYRNLTEEEREELTNIKRQFNGLSLRRLLQYVYRKYPEYTTESVIRENIS